MRTIKSFEKGLEILELISHYPGGIKIKDIANALTEPPSNLALFLNSMIHTGFVQKSTDTGLYHVSNKIHEMAYRTEENRYYRLKQIARAEMLLLRNELNENVMLAVLDGRGMHFIERFTSSRAVQILHNPEAHYPPHVTASGKAIVAFLPKLKQQKYLEETLYHKFTKKSVISAEAFQQDLIQIKDRGYAINTGEFEPEIMAVASPLMLQDRVVASLSVQFPTFRYNPEELELFGMRIMQSARNIEIALQD